MKEKVAKSPGLPGNFYTNPKKALGWVRRETD
jgi:hypothetical protein